MARRWGSGSDFLHVVDLDGARKDAHQRQKHSSHRRSSGVPCELGRRHSDRGRYKSGLDWGVTRVVIGSVLCANRVWLEKMCRKFPGKVVLGIDAKQGKVATDAGCKVSETSALELAETLCVLASGSYRLPRTLAGDGMLEGLIRGNGRNGDHGSLTGHRFRGISSAADVARLAQLPLAGCIVGRALYEGKVHLSEIITLVSP